MGRSRVVIKGKLRRCTCCKLWRPFDDYPKDSYQPDGMSYTCKECGRKLAKKYRMENREKFLEKKRALYQKLRLDPIYQEKNRERAKLWYLSNKDRYNAGCRKRSRERWKRDKSFALKSILRSRLNLMLLGYTKERGALKLLGCSLGDFKDYIARQFVSGMSWENHGLWHLDHKRPISSFDLANREEVERCFHFTNFQPLWAKDNLKKGASYASLD